MKVASIIIVSLIILSCDKPKTEPAHKLSVLTSLGTQGSISYEENLSNWNTLKKTNGNSYIYQTTSFSWTGYGSTTELKIENGIVVSRKYQGFITDGETGQKEITDFYIETLEYLGSNNLGADPLTIDQLYNTCLKDYLVADDKTNILYFKTAENGLMTLCGYRPKDCTDDCLISISIDSFEWQK